MIFNARTDYESIHTSNINSLYEGLQENADYPFRAGVIIKWCLNAKPKDRYHNFHVRIEVEDGNGAIKNGRGSEFEKMNMEEVKHFFKMEIALAKERMNLKYNPMFNGVWVGHEKQIDFKIGGNGEWRTIYIQNLT